MRAPGLYWHIHQGARDWVPSASDREVLASLAPGDAVDVYVWPRSMAKEGVGRSGEDYAFRAVSRGPIVHVLVDETETRDSIRWLIAHELGHQRVRQTGLRSFFGLGAPTDIDPAGDLYHDLSAEERWADGLATRTFGERLDRAWWRKRAPKRTSFGGLGPLQRGYRAC